MPTPHSFIFTDGHRCLLTEGRRESFTSADHAVAALREKTGARLIVGALPFHSGDTPALFSPAGHQVLDGPPALPRAEIRPRLISVTETPDTGEHRRRVAEAVAGLRAGEMDKIVLSRAVRYDFDTALDPEDLLAGFIRHSATGCGHLVDLSGAGESFRDHYFVGSSPELLIAKQGRRITSHPLAGTVARDPDPGRDREAADALTHSGKNTREHAYVTAEIRRVLEPLCTTLDIPETPELTATSHTWHLGTPIAGELKDPEITSLELAELLHPTPAVNGFPTPAARRVLEKVEPGRGFYAGALGWCDAAGDGEWRVSIRSAEICGRTATAYAGGGIVADSDPAEELTETRTKLGPVRAALGIEEQ